MPLSPGEILLPNVLSAVARETDPEYRATIRKFSTVREYSRKFIVSKAPFEIRLFSFNRRNVGWYAGTRPPKNAQRKFEYNNRCIYPNTSINFSRRCARHPRVKNVNKASFLTRLSLPVLSRAPLPRILGASFLLIDTLLTLPISPSLAGEILFLSGERSYSSHCCHIKHDPISIDTTNISVFSIYSKLDARSY